MPKLTGFGSLKTLEDERVSDKITRKIAAGDRAMIVWWDIKAGAHIAAHKHPHEQIFWLLRGRMDFRIADDMRSCAVGDFAVIPGGVEHEAWFPEDTEIIDVFGPPREDFLTGGTPAYIKK
jgi:quercetin dioxygenase-like cupin family protein